MVSFKDNGKLKLLIIVGTRPEIIVWQPPSINVGNILIQFWHIQDRIMITT